MAKRWRRAFLDALTATGNVRVACERAGIERSTAYRTRRSDPALAKRWDEAIDEAADVLEAEARRRALLGVDHPVFHRGEQVGVVRRFSDHLLMVLLKGARPEIYGDRAGEVQPAYDSGAAIVELVERIRREVGPYRPPPDLDDLDDLDDRDDRDDPGRP